jgi:4-hydroxy-2-oxoheptanedioate aldolase
MEKISAKPARQRLSLAEIRTSYEMARPAPVNEGKWSGPMELQRNEFKHAIAAGKLQIGLWNSLCSNIVTEIVCHSGFDWLLLDTEHSPNELPAVMAQLQSVQRGTATPIVRPAWNDTVLIKRILDIGAQSILVPFVQNAEEAKRAVAATRYPPEGVRGITTSGRAARYGRIKDYVKKANSEICLLVQAETREALDNLEAIASVDGVDGVFVGPADLSASFGHIGNPQHPEVQKAMEDVAKRLKKVGKPAGILTPIEEEARRYIEWGYTFVALGSDLGLLAKGADSLATKFKQK